MEDLTKTIMFTTNNLGTPATIQYQTTTDQGLKQPKIEGQKTHFFQMIAPTSQGTSTVNLAQLSDDKIQYITQPFAYAGNQMYMQIQNGITVDGRQLIVNKPIANTISNISFKCDVCGLMFSHLTLLNQHKRSHNTEDSQTDTSQAIVVTQQPGIQNIISESGQNLGQIQIVATESLEPATQTIQHTNNEITMVQTSAKDQKQKCISCNGPIVGNLKRKGPKLIRCENCINGDNNVQSIRPTQIFVAPDGDIKFEIGEITQDQLGQNIIPITQVSNNIQTAPHKPPKKKNTQGTVAQPVQQAANVTTVIKCTKCNGTGVIVLNNANSATTSSANNSGNSTSGTIVSTSPGKTTQIVQLQTQSQHQQQTQQVQQIQIQQSHQQVQQQAQQSTQMPPPQNPEKPFQCNVCGGRFSRYSSLWSHKKLHTGEKNYKCETCGIAFAKAVYLKNHQRIHTGEKPYRCNTCGMQFSQSPHLKNHERTHSGEKPYVCEVCDKGFARHATLWNHRRIHTGEKPYKCNRCQSAFSQAAHLKNHEKVHSGVKPFKCDICSAAFADRFALKRHRNIHEKYGQTAPLQSASNSNANQGESGAEIQVIKGEVMHEQEVVEMMEEDDGQKINEEELKDFDPEEPGE